MEKEDLVTNVLLYKQSMYRLALGILGNQQDAEDAISETIIKAYENLASLRNNSKFKSWIMTILVNVSKNMLTKKNRILLVDDITVFEGTVKDSQNDIWDSIMALDELHRQIIILYYYDGFSTKEIARILELPKGTVKSRLSRGREKLKVLLSL